MKENNIRQEKSFAFAVKAAELFKYLQEQKREFVLSKQFLRSATSIGANLKESIGRQSNKDFLSKISNAYKESSENMYWLKLLQATDYLKQSVAESMLTFGGVLCKILGNFQVTLITRNS